MPKVTRAATEAEKMRRVPGIVFADEAGERVVRIAGDGLEVAEIVQVFLAADRDHEKLVRAFPWLPPEQIGAALAYYAAYPDEIDRAIAENDACSGED